MTYLTKLNPEENHAIEELRKRLKNELPKSMFEDTTLLYKFLKARDFDLDKAESMIRKNISWRKHFQVDTILENFTPRPFFEKYPKLSHIGLDKNGRMVKYLPVGDLDGREVMKCVQSNEYMKHWTWHFEEIADSAKKLKEKTNIDVSQITLILNLDKLTIANATSKISIHVCTRLLRLLQDNYPESVNTIYVINTPGYYIFIYSVLKTMMSRAMMQKIQIYSHNGWHEKLLEVIDPDVLPAFLGGNRTDPDGNPLCTTFVTHGGRIPEMYHLLEEERHFSNRSLVKRISIPPKQKKEIVVPVTTAGLRIYWEFAVISKDIGFGLFYKISESSQFKEVLPVERYDTIDGVEKGSYKAKSSGIYIIVFDNSYSWMNSKEVEYCISVP